jgi:hypothetical protein
VDRRLLGSTARTGIPDRWPHILRFLQADSTGVLNGDFCRWSLFSDWLSPADRAAAYEEWADFFEWRLTQRAAELTQDPVKRYLVEGWTDDMIYGCRRSASWARGDNPGDWIPQYQRRPDLHAESVALVADIVARQNLMV